MKIMSWKPTLVGNPSCPILHMTAVLECPFCHHVHDAQSGLVVIGGEVTLETAAKETSDSIRAQRSCEGCGIVSGLPSAESKRFGKEVTTTITAAWLEEGKKALRPM